MNSTKISQPIKVGIRRSKLAIVQAEIVLARLRSHNPELQFELIYVTNPGDKIRDRPIAEVGESGVFVKELENALLAKTVAIVVHSLKDLPTEMPKDLALAAVSDREDPRDVLISHKQLKFSQLPKDATVATSSRRRSAQLLAQRKDLKFIDIRGNVPTRLKKHDDGQCNAIILAAAGLIRLGLAERITEFLPIDICLPAAGQGVLGCQCRKDDTAIYQLLSKINDPKVEAEVVAERTFLQELGGGCSVPIGALGRYRENALSLSGCVASLDGKQIIKHEVIGDINNPVQLGKELATLMIETGAEPVLSQLRSSLPNVVSPP